MPKLRERTLGIFGSLTGSLSFLGGYQVCHNLCLGIIAVLTFLGFAVAGMPLLFLTKVAIPFWIAAFFMLVVTLILRYRYMMHFSDKLIVLNSGLIVAGIPFQQVQQFNYIFWIIGGALVAASIGWYFYGKFNKSN